MTHNHVLTNTQAIDLRRGVGSHHKGAGPAKLSIKANCHMQNTQGGPGHRAACWLPPVSVDQLPTLQTHVRLHVLLQQLAEQLALFGGVGVVACLVVVVFINSSGRLCSVSSAVVIWCFQCSGDLGVMLTTVSN